MAALTKINPSMLKLDLRELTKQTSEDPRIPQIQEIINLVINKGLHNFSPLLPGVFNLKGEPYRLQDYFPFEPLFNTYLPKQLLFKTARQVGKSQGVAARGILISATIPYFNTLYVTPLYEMIRRFSGNYVKDLLKTTPMRSVWCDASTSSNVLQRSFTNGSNMYFSYAFLDAERTRGLNCDANSFDECQDLNPDFIPIIRETMSGSKYGGISNWTGTPRTLENTIEGLWCESSQAEWVIRCTRCNNDNVPALRYDLDAMIGPYHDDIDEFCPGVVCAKCKRPINPRNGRWWHERPQLKDEFPGYHIPQIIMPMHCCNKDKWAVLTGKQHGAFNTSTNVFYNEVCGESFDTGAKLVTDTDLRRAADLGHDNSYETARALIGNYNLRVLAVDWGGGGRKGDSYTVYSVLGYNNTGEIHVIYAYKSLTPLKFTREAKLTLKFIHDFRCHNLAHDYCGAGAAREAFVVQAGFPLDRIYPCWFVRAATQSLMYAHDETDAHFRAHYKIDKPRAIQLVCESIKHLKIRFFNYDNKGPDNRGLLCHFLSLVEDKMDTRLGRDIYTITKQDGSEDDFAMSVVYGACTIWFKTQEWPDLALAAKFTIDAEMEQWLKYGMQYEEGVYDPDNDYYN